MTLTGFGELGTTLPLLSVTLNAKLLVPALAGVAENTKLKLASLSCCSWFAVGSGAVQVNVTGLVPLSIQVSAGLAADMLTSEYASFPHTQPAGAVIATLVAGAHPLLSTFHVNSTLVLEALTLDGFTVVVNSPRVMLGEVAFALSAGDVLVAEPLKLNARPGVQALEFI